MCEMEGWGEGVSKEDPQDEKEKLKSPRGTWECLAFLWVILDASQEKLLHPGIDPTHMRWARSLTVSSTQQMFPQPHPLCSRLCGSLLCGALWRSL